MLSTACIGDCATLAGDGLHAGMTRSAVGTLDISTVFVAGLMSAAIARLVSCALVVLLACAGSG